MFDATENPFMSPQELSARYLGRITIDTMEKWRRDGIGPAYYKFGGKVLYRLSDVLIWECLMRRAPRMRNDRRGLWPHVQSVAAARTPLERQIAAAVDEALDAHLVNWAEVVDQLEERAA